MSESIQHKLDRVRPPRVQITYDVEIGNAIEMKELPFVVGVMADLSGKGAADLPRLKERKFVEIDRDTFNDVLKAAKPSLAFRVPDRLSKTTDGASQQLNIALAFESLDDFEPVPVLKQVPQLEKMYEARNRLRDLLAKLDGNDDLNSLLNEVLAQPDELKDLRAQVALPKPDAPDAPDAPPAT